MHYLSDLSVQSYFYSLIKTFSIADDKMFDKFYGDCDGVNEGDGVSPYDLFLHKSMILCHF